MESFALPRTYRRRSTGFSFRLIIGKLGGAVTKLLRQDYRLPRAEVWDAVGDARMRLRKARSLPRHNASTSVVGVSLPVAFTFSAEGRNIRRGRGQGAPLAREKQVLNGEPSKPNRIGHSIRH